MPTSYRKKAENCLYFGQCLGVSQLNELLKVITDYYLAVAQVWDTRALEAVAPRTAAGEPILSQALTRDEQALVASRVLARCDALESASSVVTPIN
ncbi:hypothetical protein [Pseudomonas chlororaphis]|uniref:hypothetical protein n=1 Tax=Pseudomonas chlororaphis TaxID=587753 RepID=UPI00352B9603